MKTLKSLVNKVRQFPEYFNTLDSLNACLDAENKIVESSDAAFGDQYTKFLNAQPKELQQPLGNIQTIGKKEVTVLKETHTKLAALPIDMQNLANIQGDIQRKLTAVRDAQAAATKSQIAATKAPNNNNNQKADADSKTADNLKDQTDNEITELRKRFIESLALSLKAVAESRINMSNQLGEIANELAVAVQDVHDFKDPLLVRLTQRIDSLQYEIVD